MPRSNFYSCFYTFYAIFLNKNVAAFLIRQTNLHSASSISAIVTKLKPTAGEHRGNLGIQARAGALWATPGAKSRSTTHSQADKAISMPPNETISDETTMSKEYSGNSLIPTPNRAGVETFLMRPESEIALSFLVFLSCVLFAFQTLDGVVAGEPGGVYIGQNALTAIDTTEHLIGLLFLVEYFLRWYCRGFDPRYPFTPLMLIDGAVLLPTLLGLLGTPMMFGNVSFEFLRLLRVLRLQRFFTNPESFQRTFGKVWSGAGDVKVWQLEIVRILLSIATLLFVSTGLMYECERGVNPQFSNFFAALYFGLTTLTTVGFGDIAPVTPLGRAVVCFSILFGVTIIPVQLSSLASAIVTDRKIDTSVAEAAEANAAEASENSERQSITETPSTLMAGVDQTEFFVEALTIALANELIDAYPHLENGSTDAAAAADEALKDSVRGASRRAVEKVLRHEA